MISCLGRGFVLLFDLVRLVLVFAFVCWCGQWFAVCCGFVFWLVLIMWLVLVVVCCGCRFDFGWWLLWFCACFGGLVVW